jgi:hypothetical protein
MNENLENYHGLRAKASATIHLTFYQKSSFLFPGYSRSVQDLWIKCEPLAMAYTFDPFVVKRFIAETALFYNK